MQYPQQVQTIINALWAKHQDLANGTDDQRRALTLIIAQQLRHDLGPDWGTKASGPGHPPSKDAIAERWGDVLLGWDWQNGATRQPNQYPNSTDITGQLFIDVEPIDHLGVSAPPQPPPVDPPSEPATPPAWQDALTGLLAGHQAMQADIKTLLGRPSAPQTFRVPIQAGVTALFGLPPNPAGEIVIHGDQVK